MDFSNVKLIASDMDGTLLNSKHELHPEFYSIFRALQDKGIVFAAASGRQYHNIRNVFRDIKEEMYFIAENGGYMVHQENDLFVQEMDLDLTRRLLIDAKKIEGVLIILCGKKKAYLDNPIPAFVEHLKKYYDEYEVVPDLLAVENDTFLKIAICDTSGAEGKTYEYFREKYSDLQIKVSGSIWLDLSHHRANKGYALGVLQKKLGILPTETMVFGDYLNDLEMMQEAQFSFAMENAHPEVKAVARYTAKSNDEYGVVEILKKVIQN